MGVSRQRWRRRAPFALRGPERPYLGLVAAGGAVAVIAGREVAAGHGTAVAVVALGAAFLVWTLASPEHAALAVIGTLPFLVYLGSAGNLSIFAAVPLMLLVSIVLLLRQRGSATRLRGRLPARAFAVPFVIAAISAAHSASTSTAGSRLIYLAVYGLAAWALAATLTSGGLTTRTLATAIVISAALASVALIVQLLMQFFVGQHAVISWLTGEFRLFAGARSAALVQQVQNFKISSLNLVRGIFPFMAAPSAGQYTMLGLVSAVWLLRTGPRGGSSGGRSLTLVATVLIAAGMLMTLSRQSWLGALVGIGALTLRRDPVRAVIIVALLFLCLAVIPAPGGHSTFGDYLLTASDATSTSTGTRLGLLDQAVHLVPGHWLLGVGPGQYSTLNPDPSNPIYYAHNVWLDEAVELGVAGGLALIATFVIAMRSAFGRGATLGFSLLTAYVVANLFDDVLYFPRNGILLAAAFAVAAAGDRPRAGPDQAVAPASL
jgi:hypothetical protein